MKNMNKMNLVISILLLTTNLFANSEDHQSNASSNIVQITQKAKEHLKKYGVPYGTAAIILLSAIASRRRAFRLENQITELRNEINSIKELVGQNYVKSDQLTVIEIKLSEVLKRLKVETGIKETQNINNVDENSICQVIAGC